MPRRPGGVSRVTHGARPSHLYMTRLAHSSGVAYRPASRRNAWRRLPEFKKEPDPLRHEIGELHTTWLCPGRVALRTPRPAPKLGSVAVGVVIGAGRHCICAPAP